MSVTVGEISKLEAIAILAPDGSIEMLIFPHSTQIGTKIDPQPLLVSGKVYAEKEVEILGTLKTHKAASFLSDLTVSGTLYAEKIIVEVDESVTGSLWVSGSLLVSQSATIGKGLEVNAERGSVQGTGGDDFIVFASSTGKEILSAHASSDQVLILSGGGSTSVNEFNYTDMAFFVSGTVNSKGTSIKGTTVFGGDTVISGGLYFDERTAPGTIGDGTVVLYGKDDSGVTKLYFKNESGETEVGSGGGGSTNPGGSNTQVQYNNGGSFAGGTKLLYDEANGRLKIGDTSAPSNVLDVYGNVQDVVVVIDNDQSSAAHGLLVTSDGTGADTNIFDVESGTTTIFRVRGDGKVGIGTTNPTHILSVDGAVSASMGLSGSLTRLVDGTSYLVAGANITVTSASNGQVTIESAAGASDSFKTIAVSGQSDVVADSSTDTLTLVGGNNITITTDAANDTVTFAAAAGGGGGSGDYQAKTANFTVGTSEYMFGINTSSGNLTGTLPAASSAGAGKQYIFKDIGGFAGNPSKGIHIETDSNTEKIDGAASANILVNSGSITVMTDGSNWFVVGVS